MIAGQDNDGAGASFRRQRRDHHRDTEVGGGHLAVVWTPREFARERRRRIVRRMRIVEMHPQEKRSGRILQPAGRAAGGFSGTTLQRRRRQMCPAGTFEMIVVLLVIVTEPGRRTNNERRHERRRVIAGTAQHRRDRRHRVGQREPVVVVNTVADRIPSGQDRRVRRQRQRRMRGRIDEDGASTSNRVDRRRHISGANTVCAQRVDRDHDHIWVAARDYLFLLSCSAPARDLHRDPNRRTDPPSPGKTAANSHRSRFTEVYTHARRRMSMTWKPVVPVLAFLCATLGPTNPLLAQAVQTSALTGTVKDSTGAVLPGVTVNVSSPQQIGGVQTSVTDSQGIYRFPALRPGVYEMETTLAGFKTVKRSDIVLALGTTATIDVTLSVASVSETVQVTGESPVVDVKSSASNTQLTNEMLQNLPTARFQPAIINLTPGVSGDVAFGGAQGSNALLMDGVDVSDPESGTAWSFFNYNWIEQVQVVSLGANAEYGEFTGVAANSIIRSGSNKFTGLGEYLMERKNWLADNTTSLPASLRSSFTPREIQSYWDSTAQFGGPIAKDKLFFFSGFQYFNRQDRPAGYTGDFTSEKDPRILNKLTWAATQNVRAEGFIEWDKFDVTGRGASATKPTTEVTVLEPSPEVNWNANVTWTMSAKTMLNVRNGGYWGYFPLEPTPPNTRSGPFPHFDAVTGIYSVNTNYYFRADRVRDVSAATLTHYADNFAGKS